MQFLALQKRGYFSERFPILGLISVEQNESYHLRFRYLHLSEALLPFIFPN